MGVFLTKTSRLRHFTQTVLTLMRDQVALIAAGDQLP
jgi:hypothetical protein